MVFKLGIIADNQLNQYKISNPQGICKKTGRQGWATCSILTGMFSLFAVVLNGFSDRTQIGAASFYQFLGTLD